MNLCAIAFMLGCQVAGPFSAYQADNILMSFQSAPATNLTFSSEGKSISIDRDGKVTCPAMISDKEAKKLADEIQPYGGVYLALWRAYCPAKPLSTFERR